MNEVKDFFKELKERATSPLFGSFIISWLVINWQVTTVILFNNADTMKMDRWMYIFQIVKIFGSWWCMFVYPLLLAIAYIICYPYIRRKIKWYIALQESRTNSEILRSSGLEPVSLENYITMVQAQDDARNNLAKLINSQEKTNDKLKSVEAERDKIRVDLISSESTLKLRDQALDDRKMWSDFTSFRGHWYMYLEGADGETIEFPWFIDLDYILINLLAHPIYSFVADYEKRIVSFSVKAHESRRENNEVQVRVQQLMVFSNDFDISTFIFKVDDDMQTLTSLPNSPFEYRLLRNKMKEEK